MEPPVFPCVTGLAAAWVLGGELDRGVARLGDARGVAERLAGVSTVVEKLAVERTTGAPLAELRAVVLRRAADSLPVAAGPAENGALSERRPAGARRAAESVARLASGHGEKPGAAGRPGAAPPVAPAVSVLARAAALPCHSPAATSYCEARYALRKSARGPRSGASR